MRLQLLFQGFLKYMIGIILVGLLMFLPAGSISYWNGWLLMGLLFIPMFFIGVFLLLFNPSLLQSRLDSKEKEKEQKSVLLFSSLMFIFGFVIAGFNYRYQWFLLPRIVVILSSVLFFISYLLYMEVLRENTYLSRTIQVQKDQKVIDTGLYGVVRHPMYATTIIMFLTMPLVLGSFYSFCIFLLYPFLICKRI